MEKSKGTYSSKHFKALVLDSISYHAKTTAALAVIAHAKRWSHIF